MVFVSDKTFKSDWLEIYKYFSHETIIYLTSSQKKNVLSKKCEMSIFCVKKLSNNVKKDKKDF